MLHQNACLRKSIRLEFTKLNGGAKYSAAMAEYRETLLSAADSNDAALHEVFGPRPRRGCGTISCSRGKVATFTTALARSGVIAQRIGREKAPRRKAD